MARLNGAITPQFMCDFTQTNMVCTPLSSGHRFHDINTRQGFENNAECLYLYYEILINAMSTSRLDFSSESKQL